MNKIILIGIFYLFFAGIAFAGQLKSCVEKETKNILSTNSNQTYTGIGQNDWYIFKAQNDGKIEFTLKAEKNLLLKIFNSCDSKDYKLIEPAKNSKTINMTILVSKNQIIRVRPSVTVKTNYSLKVIATKTTTEKTKPNEEKITEPKISNIYISQNVEAGLMANFSWKVTGNYDKVGYIHSFTNNGRKATIINYVEKTKNNEYTIAMLTNKSEKYVFIEAFAEYKGKKYNGNYETIIVFQPKENMAEPKIIIQELDLVKLGLEGAKILTIGNCIDNGIWDIWCGLDVAFLGAALYPAGGQFPEAIKISNALVKLETTAKLLKTIKTAEQFGQIVKEIKIIYKNEKTITKTGLDFVNLLKTGIVKNTGEEIQTVTPNLFRYAMEKGDYSITRLLSSNSNINSLEKIAGMGKDLSKTKWAIETKNIIKLPAVWLEEGTTEYGLKKILATSTKDFEKGLGIKPGEISNAIKTVVENPKSVIKNNTTQTYDFYKDWKFNGITKQIKVSVSYATNNIGNITNAIPI